MPERIPEQTRAAIEAAIRAGGKRNEIAREHGVSPSTVTKVAKEAGITRAFDRSQTEKGTRARQFDAKAARAQLVADLYADAQRFRARAWEPYTQIVSSQGGPELVTTKLPPLRDQQSGYTALAICLDKALALERHDSTDDGLAVGKNMVNDLFGALKMAYHQVATEDAAAPQDAAAE